MEPSEPSLRGGSPWLCLLESTCSQVLQAWPRPSITFSLEECHTMDFLVLSADSCFQVLHIDSGSIWAAWHCQLVSVHDPLVECLPEKAGSSAGWLGACGCGWPLPSSPYHSSMGKASDLSPSLGLPSVSQHWHSAALSIHFLPGVGGADLLEKGWGSLTHTVRVGMAWRKHPTVDLLLHPAPVSILLFTEDNGPSCCWLTVKMNSGYIRQKCTASQNQWWLLSAISIEASWRGSRSSMMWYHRTWVFD